MYLMYVDESGDPGLAGSPTEIFVLCGLVVHELRWRRTLEALVAFRRRMRDAFGLKLREEVDCAHFISSPGTLKRIKRNDRLAILRHYADQLASIPDLSLISVAVDKRCWSAEVDVYQAAWRALVQRFENTLSYDLLQTCKLSRSSGDRAAGQIKRGACAPRGDPSRQSCCRSDLAFSIGQSRSVFHPKFQRVRPSIF